MSDKLLVDPIDPHQAEFLAEIAASYVDVEDLEGTDSRNVQQIARACLRFIRVLTPKSKPAKV